MCLPFLLCRYFLYIGPYVNMEQDDETPDHDTDASMGLAQLIDEESTYVILYKHI